MYRVSTVTAIGSFGGVIDIGALFRGVDVEVRNENRTVADGKSRRVPQELDAGVSVDSGARNARGSPARTASPFVFAEYVNDDGIKETKGSKVSKKGQATAALLERQRRQSGKDSPLRPLEVVEGESHPASRYDDGKKTAAGGKQPSDNSSDRSPPGNKRAYYFNNQVTLAVVVPVDPLNEGSDRLHRSRKNGRTEANDGDGDAETPVNMKVFRNGNVQMTGAKSIAQGKAAMHLVVAVANGIEGVCAHPLRVTDYRVCLINSDYDVGWQIRRDKLYDILSAEFDLTCSFEPCIYPGVKIQYFWNVLRDADAPTERQHRVDNRNDDVATAPLPSRTDGACACKKPCSGRGVGNGDGDCRKVTIAVFRSGCIIVTGAHSYEQLDRAYAFVLSVLEKNKEILLNVPKCCVVAAAEGRAPVVRAKAAAASARGERRRRPKNKEEPPLPRNGENTRIFL